MSEQATASDPILPEVKMNLVSPKAPVTARIVSNDRCLKGKSASFIRHTVVDVSGTPLAGNFLAGQSFGVIPPGVDERDKPHLVRLFSVACPRWGEDGKGQLVSTTPKRVIDEFRPQRAGDDLEDHNLFLGVCSNYLCDLCPGAQINVTGPNGKRFLLPVNRDDHDYLFLATGTGIAPYRGMLIELLEAPEGPCRSRMHLVMGSPYTTDLLYDDLFRRLEAEHDNFTYHTAISREPRPETGKGRYVHHVLDEEMDQFKDLLESPRTLIYICGLIGMQFGVFTMLAARGVADGFLTISDELAGTDPAEWTRQQIKRQVRPTRRCMVEVY